MPAPCAPAASPSSRLEEILHVDAFGLCAGCMSARATHDARCPSCHWRLEDEQAHAEEALAPGTVLNEQYRIGRVLRRDGIGISYIAFDLVALSKVAIHEYYPAGL